MAAAADSPEAKELSLVGKVELRIALADSDARLEAILKTYLSPLLLKLASEHGPVRNKVLSILQHVNTRIQPPSIKLPLVALLKQFKDPATAPLIRHFDLLYLQQGIARVPPSERLELLPTLIHGIHSDAAKSASNGAGVFNLLLKLTPHLRLPPRGSNEDGELRERLGLHQSPDDAAFVASYFGKVILLTVGRMATHEGDSAGAACPGLTPEDFSFLTLSGKKETWDPAHDSGSNLTETKLAVCRFLASGAFTDRERHLPALFASADPNSNISQLGDDMLKRTSPNISLEDAALVESLFAVYLGQAGARLQAARPPLQAKIAGLLSRSAIATTFTDSIIQMVEEGIIVPSSPDDHGTASKLPSGREASKLRGAIFSFVNWVARMASTSDLRRIAPRLVYGLRDYIESQGWPTMNTQGDYSPESALRGYAYEIIGLLAKASADELLSDPNIDLVRWLFTSLSADTSAANISVSIGEALGTVLQALSNMSDAEVQTSLRSLLLHHMSLEIGEESPAGHPSQVQRSTRFVAVRFATRCLPYHDVVARWICLLAVGGRANERNEVVEEGRKGLNPYWYRMLNPPKDGLSSQPMGATDPRYRFPDFSELVHYCFSGSHDTAATRENLTSLGQFDGKIGVFEAAVAYCRRALLAQALRTTEVAIDVDVHWEGKLDAAVSSDEAARAGLTRYLASFRSSSEGEGSDALSLLLQASLDGLTWNEGDGLGQCGEYLVELCSLSDNATLGGLAPQVRRLHNPILSNKVQVRTDAAHLFGILGSHEKSDRNDIGSLGESFMKKAKSWRTAIGTDVNRVHGSILALSFYLSRRGARQTWLPGFDPEAYVYIHLVRQMVTDATDTLLQEAAISAIEQLSLFGIIGPSLILTEDTAKSLADSLLSKAKAGNEKSIVALGRFAMNCSEDDPLLGQLLTDLCQLHELRQAEVQFTVGEALSCAALGWDSKSLVAHLDVDVARPKSAARSGTLSEVLDKVLEDAKQTKPGLRRACCIWLLCLIQYGGHLPDVQKRLRVCQAAFKAFLSDRDELVQESASRGLTLIYEKGDRDLKDDLVRDLVASFTGTSANLSGNVDEDTELFAPGALPTGDGSVSTYKDIMSLASEVGDPSLVYRFMSMASSNAIWSSRAAFGRFGLGNILSESSVDGYLAQNPKLYPKLYRYRFDPNTKVQKSMNDIWTALVKDSAATIDEHFDEIMDDLLQSIVGREWRVRQASCAAIADLVQGRRVEKYEKYLGQIWTMAFKVLDDIKESVRAAAMSLCRVLTGMLVRSVEAGTSSTKSNAMLDNVMPFLMSPSGLEASAQEVQVFALDTILRLAKTGNKSLGPFVPSLVERLLGLLSTLEPEAVNYLHLNASKYNLTEDKIDAARLKSVRSSPVMDAVERCLDILDDDTMRQLVPRLENAIKQAVGMPSKVGCSRILVSLSTRHNLTFRPYAGTFLKTMEKAVRDRNDTVSSSYAVAAGYLARLVPDTQVLEMCEFSKRLYFHGDDERQRLTAGEIVYAMCKHATDRFSSLAAEFLPFAFVAKHDSQEHVREPFEKTWEESAGGNRTVLLYLAEIVSLALQHLDSASWVLKHAAALSIADAANAGGSLLSEQQQQTLWPALERALKGKSWDGKERVLSALVKFSRHCAKLQQSQPAVTEQIRKLVLHESRRKNAAYRQHALVSLGEFVDGYEAEDLSLVVLDLVGEVVEEQSGEGGDDMEVDAGAGSAPTDTSRPNTVAHAVAAGFRAVDPRRLPDQAVAGRVGRLLDVAEKARAMKSGGVHAAICRGVTTLAGRLRAADASRLVSLTDGPAGDDTMMRLILLVSPLGDGGTAERAKRAEAADELAQLSPVIGLAQGSAAPARLRAALVAARGAERDRSVQAILDRALGR
ncbi:MAG: proteasome component M29 [Thelocarpon impressellum]|nr:MAG: proteasome component M29 [Thelocarpon impressellum]